MMWAIVQTRFEQIEPDELRDALVHHGGMTRVDAARAALHRRGILGETFSEAQASDVARALLKRGYQVQAVPADSLPELKRPRIVRWCEVTQDALHIPVDAHANTTAVEWLSVFVLNADLMAQSKRNQTADYVPRSPSDERFSDVDSVDDEDYFDPPLYSTHLHYGYVMDLIAIDGSGRLMYARMPADELAYERVFPGRTRMRRFERFLKLVELLVQRCEQAIIAPDTRKLLFQRVDRSRVVTAEHRQYADENAFFHYDRWLMTLAIREERERLQHEGIE